MFALFKRNPVAFASAVILHILILLFLLFGVDWISKPKQVTPKVAVVQAHTVDASKLAAELNKLKQSEAQQKAEKEAALRNEEQRLADLQRQQADEKKRLIELEKQRKATELEAQKRDAAAQQKREAEAKQQAEEKRKAELKRKAKAEAEAKREAQAKVKAEAEAKRKADAKAKAEAEAKRKAEAKAKAEAEAKRQAEAKVKAEAEAKRQAEAKAKAEAEAKRQAEAAAQAAREKALQDQMAAEQNAREIDRYVAVLTQQVNRSWLRPPNAGQGLSCVVRVRLIPGGDVVPGGVSIIQSSGNSAFDRSVETAIYKAAPLPVPSGNLFESFRTLTFNFKPSGK